MTKKEFENVALAIKAAYPMSNTIPDPESMRLWFMMLEDLDYNICQNAVLEYVSSNKFPPGISDIRTLCRVEMCEKVVDWGTAWGNVMKAIQQFGFYRVEEALESLDEITRAIVKKMGFRELCLTENLVADRAHFSQMYEQYVRRLIGQQNTPKFVLQKKQLFNLPDVVQEVIPEKPEHIEQQRATPEHIDTLMKRFRGE